MTLKACFTLWWHWSIVSSHGFRYPRGSMPPKTTLVQRTKTRRTQQRRVRENWRGSKMSSRICQLSWCAPFYPVSDFMRVTSIATDGFADLYQYIVSLGHSDKPDYEKITRILEKGKLRYEIKTGEKTNTLVSQEVRTTCRHNEPCSYLKTTLYLLNLNKCCSIMLSTPQRESFLSRVLHKYASVPTKTRAVPWHKISGPMLTKITSKTFQPTR